MVQLKKVTFRCLLKIQTRSSTSLQLVNWAPIIKLMKLYYRSSSSNSTSDNLDYNITTELWLPLLSATLQYELNKSSLEYFISNNSFLEEIKFSLHMHWTTAQFGSHKIVPFTLSLLLLLLPTATTANNLICHTISSNNNKAFHSFLDKFPENDVLTFFRK